MAKKKKTQAEIRNELRELQKPSAPAPPADLKKAFIRVGLVVGALWIVAVGVSTFAHASWPLIAAAVLTLAVAGVVVWVLRMVKKQQALGAIMQGADTEEGRKEAIRRLETDFKGNDAQALIAKANLQMQQDPRAALVTLEKINLDKELAPVAGQVRAMKAMILLNLGEVQAARAEVDLLELGKQQEPKIRAMFAAVSAEAWARTGQAKKAMDTLEVFNPDDPELADLKPQMLRAKAFSYAAQMDSKGVVRSLKKLAEINPHLLGMFVGQKKVHPLLEKEAKQLVMQLGVAPRQMVRQRM